MSCWTCSSTWKALSRAAAKSAGAKFRAAGGLRISSNWTARAEMCERCPMRVIVNKTSYCGKPFLNQMDRDESTEGCGCPTIAKAKNPDEHCPIDARFSPAEQNAGVCTCKWCNAIPAKV
jgi:hypothetical protein